MTTAMMPVAAPDAAAIEKVLIGGDLSKLNESQRVSYYNSICQSLGLNPLTKPFEYITLQGKLTLYARRDATEQLRKIHGVSITQLAKDFHADLYIVTANASDKTGRSDASTGAVSIKGLSGENLANALMKAETKAKRRVTLSICGLGMLDETEAVDVAAQPAPTMVIEAPKAEAVDTDTGEVVEATPKTEPGAAYHWIVRCEDHLGRAGKKKATITFTDGTAATIWKPGDQLFDVCVDLMQKVARVVPTFQFKEGYAPTLKRITRYVDPEGAQHSTSLGGAQEPIRDDVPPVQVGEEETPF